MSEEVKIIETKKVPTGATLIFAFPDVGLVGVIAASHLIDELGLTEVAYLDSNLLPPLIVLHEGLTALLDKDLRRPRHSLGGLRSTDTHRRNLSDNGRID